MRAKKTELADPFLDVAPDKLKLAAALYQGITYLDGVKDRSAADKAKLNELTKAMLVAQEQAKTIAQLTRAVDEALKLSKKAESSVEQIAREFNQLTRQYERLFAQHYDLMGRIEQQRKYFEAIIKPEPQKEAGA